MSFPSVIQDAWCFRSEKTVRKKAKHGSMVTISW